MFPRLFKRFIERLGMTQLPVHHSAPQLAIPTFLNRPESLVVRIFLFEAMKHDPLRPTRPLDNPDYLALSRTTSRARFQKWHVGISVSCVAAAGTLCTAWCAMWDRRPGRSRWMHEPQFAMLYLDATDETLLHLRASGV